MKLQSIAHSTRRGNRTRRLAELANGSTIASHPKFGELILFPCGRETITLGRVMPSIKSLGVGVTSYSSVEDWAMWISQTIR